MPEFVDALQEVGIDGSGERQLDALFRELTNDVNTRQLNGKLVVTFTLAAEKGSDRLTLMMEPELKLAKPAPKTASLYVHGGARLSPEKPGQMTLDGLRGAGRRGDDENG